MKELCDHLLAFPSKDSKGTILTINIAKDMKRTYTVISIK